MKAILLVAFGGALGSVARFKLSGYVLQHTIDWRFPAGTFTVNVVGCLIAGVLAGMAEKHDFFTADTRLLLFTGILGGFTTFSAFGLETLFLLKRGEVLVAGANVVLSVIAVLSARARHEVPVKGFLAAALLVFAGAAPAAAPKCPAFGKSAAFEVYTWRAGDEWMAAVLPAVDRTRTEREIKSTSCKGPIFGTLDGIAMRGERKRAPEAFWLHRGIRGFEYPPEDVVDYHRSLVRFSPGIVLYGPPKDGDPAAPLELRACREQEAALGKRGVPLRKEQDALAVETAAIVQARASSRLQEHNGRIGASTDAVAAHNREVDALVAACGHRIKLRGDVAGLEAPSASFFAVAYRLVNDDEDAALTQSALGTLTTWFWAHPKPGLLEATPVAFGEFLIANPGMSPALKQKHMALIDRGVGSQRNSESVSQDGYGQVLVFYSIARGPGIRMMEVVVLVYHLQSSLDSKAGDALDRILGARRWHSVGRAVIAPGADPFAVYTKLVDDAFRMFMLPPPDELIRKADPPG